MPRRVLIVEDDFLIATQIEHCLTDAGYEVIGSAADAAQAVALAERTRPDIVLMDINLPGGRDGIDAAGEILERFGIRSLYVSAHDDERTVTRTMGTRPLGWLVKPFTERALLEAVREAFAAK